MLVEPRLSVRLHGKLWRDDDPAKIDEVKIDGVRYLVAALARRGIYLALSSYFPVRAGPPPGRDCARSSRWADRPSS